MSSKRTADANRERQFVTAFVRRDLQERICFELGSKTKRRKFFSRLAHGYEAVFVANAMFPVPSYTVSEEVDKITAALISNGAQAQCYLMSHSEEIDCTECTLREGVALVVQATMPTILVCGDALALFKGELTRGPPPQFILKQPR